jgi:hypothetical protein
MKYSEKMMEHIETKGLNLELVELTLLAIFSCNKENVKIIDKVKDFVLSREERKGVMVNSYVKLHAFEELYLLTAIKEIKKLNARKD